MLKKTSKILLIIIGLFFLSFFLSSCSGEQSTLPKEFYGGMVRGKIDDLAPNFFSGTFHRRYTLAIMGKDSVLYALEVPLVFYNTYQKGDTIK